MLTLTISQSHRRSKMEFCNLNFQCEIYGTTSWEIDGETVETVSDFILGGSKITTDGNCSHEIKDTYSLEGKL